MVLEHKTRTLPHRRKNVVLAETQEEAEKIIYQHINPVYACDLGIGELEPGKNYESIYIPVQCFR